MECFQKHFNKVLLSLFLSHYVALAAGDSCDFYIKIVKKKKGMPYLCGYRLLLNCHFQP